MRVATRLALTAALLVAAPAGAQVPGKPAAAAFDRTVLPIAPPARVATTEIDARKVKSPPRFEVKAPKGAPNVVIVLIDDLGFGAPSTFGGPIPTPTLDTLARNGLRYNNFHTTALCSPTRVALKSGRNHHTSNMRRTMCRRSGSRAGKGSSTRAGTSCARSRWRARSRWA